MLLCTESTQGSKIVPFYAFLKIVLYLTPESCASERLSIIFLQELLDLFFSLRVWKEFRNYLCCIHVESYNDSLKYALMQL